MAYSKAPTLDTYSSERVLLFREMAIRDGSTSGKDEDYLNVTIEPVKQTKVGDQRKFIMKRAGTEVAIASVASSTIRGMYYWPDQYKLFYCVGRNIYVVNTSTFVSTTLVNVFATSTGSVGFCEFLYDNGTVKICASDGTAITGLVTIDSTNTVAVNADVDLPAHDPNIVFIDGYLFALRANSAEIWNSANNDPFSWDPTSFISTEMEADLVIRISKLNNYLIAFGRETIEYFWDAANTPGTPLQRNDTPVKINAYIGGLSIYGNIIYYIGADANGQPDVFVLKDFKCDSVATPSISRYLSSATDGVTNWAGNIISVQGHSYYMVTAGTAKTFIYDVETQLWMRWAFQQNSTFDLAQSCVVSTSLNTKTYFALANGTSTIYRFDKDLYQDAGVNFTCTVVTEGNDFGTLNRKTMKRLSLIGDRTPITAYMNVSWSDDDYQSFTTPRSVNLNQDLASTYQLGSFRQRIFKLTFTENTLMRIQDMEVDINKGNS
jgi:Phage stabilisation protein